MSHFQEIRKIMIPNTQNGCWLGKLNYFTQNYQTLNNHILNGSSRKHIHTQRAQQLRWTDTSAWASCMIFKFQAIGQLNACSIWTDWKTFKACGPVNGKFAYQRTMVVRMSHQGYREIAKIAFLRETFPGIERLSEKRQSSSCCQLNISGLPSKTNPSHSANP